MGDVFKVLVKRVSMYYVAKTPIHRKPYTSTRPRWFYLISFYAILPYAILLCTTSLCAIRINGIGRDTRDNQDCK